MSLTVELQKYTLNREYPLIEFGHTTQTPPLGALVRIAEGIGKYKDISYVVVQCLKPTIYDNMSESDQIDRPKRRTAIAGVNVFSRFNELQRTDKEHLGHSHSDCRRDMMSTGGSVTTVAVLAEDFFEYLKTAKMPLEEQFPPNGGFNLSKDIERQLPATNKPSYELGQTYELDAFSYLQSPKKGALLKLEYPLEKGGVSIKNVVFHNFEQCKIPSAEGDIWTTFVTGLDLGDPDGWHAQQLAVCGKKFIGCTQGKPRKITVVADDYCASKTTDMKTPES